MKLLVLFLLLAAGRAQAARPNVIVILADDLGYSDIGPYGGEIATPNLDRLAKNGLRFTQFYNTARCCPTRASLLTGVYSHQAGIGHMTADTGHPSYRGFLNDRVVTIAEALKPAGYFTAIAGKWHVGTAPSQLPRKRGFDRYYGLTTGAAYYKPNFEKRTETRLVIDDQIIEPKDVPDDWYFTDAVTDNALRFIDEAHTKKAPFFLYMAHVAPHFPLQAKKADIDKYRGRYDGGWDKARDARYKRLLDLGIIDKGWALSPRDGNSKPWADEPPPVRAETSLRMSVYAALVDSVDQSVGRLVAKLESTGQLDNTLIFFLSDNGANGEGGPHGPPNNGPVPVDQPGSYLTYPSSWANVSNVPFRLFKHYVHEGGISTPLIAHWPARIRTGGQLRSQVGHVIDLLPTALDAAGVKRASTFAGKKLVPLEGKSLLPAFANKPIARDALYWEHEGNRAVRVGQWKLVARHEQPWELYDMRTDRTELHDLAAQQPARVKELTAKWDAWAKKVGVQPWVPPVKADTPRKP